MRNEQEGEAAVSLEVAFDLAEESVHLSVLLFVELLADPRQTGQHHVHEPVGPDLRRQKHSRSQDHTRASLSASQNNTYGLRMLSGIPCAQTLNLI